MLGRTHNCQEQFLAGTVTLFYLFLPVKLAVFESFIDDVCNSFVCGNSCCFRLKFHLCFCWGCDPSRYRHAAASPFFSPNKSSLVYMKIWLDQESYPERALLCSLPRTAGALAALPGTAPSAVSLLLCEKWGRKGAYLAYVYQYLSTNLSELMTTFMPNLFFWLLIQYLFNI